MFKVMYKLPNFNFQTLIKDHQGYYTCSYLSGDRDDYVHHVSHGYAGHPYWNESKPEQQLQ